MFYIELNYDVDNPSEPINQINKQNTYLIAINITFQKGNDNVRTNIWNLAILLITLVTLPKLFNQFTVNS